MQITRLSHNERHLGSAATRLNQWHREVSNLLIPNTAGLNSPSSLARCIFRRSDNQNSRGFGLPALFLNEQTSAKGKSYLWGFPALAGKAYKLFCSHKLRRTRYLESIVHNAESRTLILLHVSPTHYGPLNVVICPRSAPRLNSHIMASEGNQVLGKDEPRAFHDDTLSVDEKAHLEEIDDAVLRAQGHESALERSFTWLGATGLAVR